jgi:serine/threonine protein kinase
MNAEALIGTVLGTCTLQEVIGQGGMGAVYLAQQARPSRQVAVKVLMPMTSVTSNQLAAFLERFRRETDAAASLEHPNIVPVHEYGEQDGLAYLVMPYVAGGTLRDEMERERQLPLSKVVNYLEQLSSALDFAHERGVIHRDIKPANILLTPTGRLLLTDFGLVKIVAAEQAPRVHLTGIGMPMGTPDYMAPEQVTGDNVDGRADLYALGVVLYQMLTGTTPFQGETPMQIAARHLQSPPPSPRILRPELPVAAEQVILRALAKRPADRYNHAQDLANAFRIALESSGLPLGYSQVGLFSTEGSPATRSFKPRPRGLFDPAWQAGRKETGKETSFSSGVSPGGIPTTPPIGDINIEATRASADSAPAPATQQPVRSSMGLRTSLRRLSDGTGTMPAPAAEPVSNGTGITPLPASAPSPPVQAANPATPTPDMPQPTMATEMSPMIAADMAPFLAASSPGMAQPASPDGNGNVTRVLPADNITRTLSVPNSKLGTNSDGGSSNTMKLTAAFKVVQVPVAGQPGRYMTGLLPVTPETKAADSLSKDDNGDEKLIPNQPIQAYWKRVENLSKPTKIIAVLVAVILILSTSMLWLAHSHSSQMARQPSKRTNATPNVPATTAAQETATADANIILADPLNQNIHNWLISTSGTRIYIFKDGAYHITDNDSSQSAPALLQDMPPSILHIPLSYSLTMEEIKGNDSSVNNSFGLIFRFTSAKKGGKVVTTFYTFEVTNTKGGEYQFWKYDDQYGSSTVTPWTKIWHQNFGKEYHVGHGSGSINTFKVFMNGSSFTFYVNGKQVGSARENSISSGQVGMLVNLKGTEVAFTNFLLAYH